MDPALGSLLVQDLKEDAMPRSLALILALPIALLTGGCDAALQRQEPYRCLHEASLQALLEAEGVPHQPQSWGVGRSETVSENRLFDGDQEAVLRLDDPGSYVARLCGRLKEQLASRCDVREFRAGGGYCAAAVDSPRNPTTAPAGVHAFRPTHGRAVLFSTRMPDGKAQVVLTTTEWAD